MISQIKRGLIIGLFVCLWTSCGPRSTIHPNIQKGETKSNPTLKNNHRPYQKSGDVCSIPMRRDGGVCYVMVKINGVDMEVIFDTGASDVVISSVEALFLLKQGRLDDDDVLGTSYYKIADGSIASGTVIKLRSVQIGDKVLSDVRATVVDNMEAPLLLGQSALDRFSSVNIDYANNRINIR